MFNFKGFITKEKNTHLEHLEDDIINRGARGGDNAIKFLKSIRNMLAGSSGGKVNMSVKWDGAPAIVCGINPENGKFFVGTKSVFNVKPKINYTSGDIMSNHSGPVADKLQVCLRELKKLKGHATTLQRREVVLTPTASRSCFQGQRRAVVVVVARCSVAQLYGS